MPQEWRKSLIITIPKKGDLEERNNYRGISLLNTAYKILTKVILTHLRKYTENIIGQYQCGFRKNKSTTDALHIITQILEKSYEFNIHIHILFIDFRRAFDSVNREKLIQEMQEMKIPTKIIRLTKMTLECNTAVVRTSEGDTDEISCNSGVKQGDALSAELFNIAVESLYRKMNCKGTININETQMIAYADDVALISRTKFGLINTFKQLRELAADIGLEVNSQKTKYMRTPKQPCSNTTHINMGDFVFEEVASFNYRGVLINNRLDREENIKKRIQEGYKAYYSNSKTLKNKKLSNTTKIRIYRTLIRPVVTYAAEVMALSKNNEEQLKIFERKVMRKILGPKKIGEELRSRWNQEILEDLEGEDIVKFIKSQRMRWYGHVFRSEDKNIIKSLTKWKPTYSRRKGRPKNTWREDVEKDLRTIGISNWQQKINNRAEWRTIANLAKTHDKL